MNVEQLERAYRIDTGDTVAAKYLCSPESFLLRLNEAQREAARRSHMLVDSTSEITRLDAGAEDPVIELDSRIIKVRRLSRLPQRYPLTFRLARSLDACEPGWEGATPGLPRNFVPDWQSGVLRLHPAPRAAMTFLATVIREPLYELKKGDDTPEFAPRHHLALLEWVKFLTYNSQDSDTFDPQAADKVAGRFTNEFGPAIGAINEHWSAEQEYDTGEF